MSKPTRRLNRTEIETRQKKRNQAHRELRYRQEAAGLKKESHRTIANGKSRYQSVAEEGAARNEATLELLKAFHDRLPVLLSRLSKIPDPRNANKTKHKLSVLLLFGVLTFILQISSSREATREMSRPQFWENIKSLIPDLEEIPHHDTLKRVLSAIDVRELENLQLDLIRKWIRNKKFARYLINGCYPLAVDGTQKITREWQWDEECQQRTFNRGEIGERTHYSAYVLQASLAFAGGLTLPLMSEFLCASEGDAQRSKQDCEQNAFLRLAARLKAAFPCLPIILLLDGLYTTGPVMALCRQNKWQFMIVLKDGALPNVITEFKSLAELEPGQRHMAQWGGRRQQFTWANDIEYDYGRNGQKRQIVHVVECLESWEEIGRDGTVEDKKSRHVWLSSAPLDRWNLHERCNLGARHRWNIETQFLVEKHHGYQYQHCFSYDWNAMKGYHYLMQLGHLFNVMARYSDKLSKIVKETGIRGLTRLVRETIASPWLDRTWISEQLSAPFRLRLV